MQVGDLIKYTPTGQVGIAMSCSNIGNNHPIWLVELACGGWTYFLEYDCEVVNASR